MSLDIRLRAYAPNGASLGYLPSPDSFSLSHPLNDVGALTLQYGTVAARASLLGQPVEIAAEVTGDGGATWLEPPGCRFLYLRDGRDPLKTADAYQVEAPSYAWLLKKARLYADPVQSDPTKRSSTNYGASYTPGLIFGVYFDEAKARGALAGMTRTWTNTLDSAGRAWPDLVAPREFDVGVDYLALLMDLADAGFIEWQTNGRDLNLYVPGTDPAAYYRDRTVGANAVALTPLNSPSAPFRRTWEGLASHVISRGEGFTYAEMTNMGAAQPWGRWEDYYAHQGVSDTGTLQALNTLQAELTATPRSEFTQELVLGGQGAVPYVDFRTGDMVLSRVLDGPPTPYRVQQITLQKQGNQVQGNVILGDRFLEQDIALKRRMEAMTGGSVAGGSTGSLPGADILPPAAPGAPVLTSTFYTDAAGVPHTQVTVNWPDVTTNMDGTTIRDLARYEVYGKRSVDVGWTLLTTTDSNASIAYLSPFDPGAAWDFRVRAIDTAGNWSAYSPTASLTTPTDTVAPAVPSQPGASSADALVTVTWDGKNSAGNPQVEPDLARVEVHLSSVSGFTPVVGDSTTLRGSFYGSGGGRLAISGEPVGATKYVRLVAIDTSANASAASVQRSVVVAGKTDGLVPVVPGGWAVTLKPLGLMSLVASWAAVTNADPVLYDVWASTTSPVTKDAAHFIGTAGGTSQSFSAINGVDLVAGQDYYVAVVPKDTDGSAVGTGTAGPTRVAQGGTGDIDPAFTYLGPISADQLVTGNLEANVAIIGELSTAGSGRKVSISSAGGLKAVDPSGDVVAQIPTDLSQDISLQADVVAKSVTALGSVAMRASNNELAQAATLVLRGATAAPVSPPTASIEWETLDRTPGPLGAAADRGGSYHPGTNTVYFANTFFGYSSVRIHNADTGAFVDSITIGNPDAGFAIDLYAVARYGNDIYCLVHENLNWKIRRHNATTKAFVSEWTLGTDANPTSTYYMGLPGMTINQDTGALVIMYQDPTQAGGAGRMVRWTANRDTGASASVLVLGGLGLIGDVNCLYEGTADLGASRMLVNGSGVWGGDILVANPATGLRDTTLEFPTAYGDPLSWLVWDSTDSRFKSQSRNSADWHFYDSGNKWTTESPTWYVTNTWRDTDVSSGSTAHETTQGPPAVVTMKKRARLAVTTPPIPVDPNNLNLDDPNAVSIYVGRVDGTRATQWRQAQPANLVRNATITAAIFSNADTLHPNPPLANNFPNLTPARVESEATDVNGPLTWFDGSGMGGRWNGLPLDTAWQNITLPAGVGNIAGFATARCRRAMGWVICEGLVNGQALASGYLLGTLPVNHRPLNGSLRFDTQLASTGGGHQVGTVTVATDGTIRVDYFAVAGNVAAASFAPIAFFVG